MGLSLFTRHPRTQDWLALGDTGVACMSLPGTHKIIWGAKFLEKRGHLTNEPSRLGTLKCGGITVM